MNLQEAVDRVQAGDTAAFRDVVERTKDTLVRLGARILGNATDAEDAVQEAYVKAYEAIIEGTFDARANLSTWLYRVVTNQCIDVLRSGKRRKALSDVLLDTGAGATSVPPDVQVALRELSDHLDQLPADQRVALVLKSIEGCSTKEIAEIMQCSEGAVEQRLVRARATLKQRSADHARASNE